MNDKELQERVKKFDWARLGYYMQNIKIKGTRFLKHKITIIVMAVKAVDFISIGRRKEGYLYMIY